MTLLERYIEAHNAGVRNGSFDGLEPLFSRSAVMRFHGLPIGPFIGREAILNAFRVQPPDDEIHLQSIEDTPAGQRARYSWATAPDRPCGTLEVVIHDGLIHELTVSVIS